MVQPWLVRLLDARNEDDQAGDQREGARHVQAAQAAQAARAAARDGAQDADQDDDADRDVDEEHRAPVEDAW